MDVHGNVYVADYLNNRVVKATPSGSTYTQSTVPTSTLPCRRRWLSMARVTSTSPIPSTYAC